MSLASDIRSVKERLQIILENSNAAIADKGGAAAADLAGIPEAITALPAGSGDIVISGLTYVVGTPVAYTISSWDEYTEGHRKSISIQGYTVGENGVQVGLMSDSSAENTAAVVAAALTVIRATSSTNSNTGVTTTTIYLTAVYVPTEEITVAFFGLEAA